MQNAKCREQIEATETPTILTSDPILNFALAVLHFAVPAANVSKVTQTVKLVPSLRVGTSIVSAADSLASLA